MIIPCVIDGVVLNRSAGIFDVELSKFSPINSLLKANVDGEPTLLKNHRMGSTDKFIEKSPYDQ